MKIRLTRNSIRFRLKQPEVIIFEREGFLTEKAEFGSQEEDCLCFSLKSYDGAELIIQKEKNKVVVSIPQKLADQWTGSNLVGLDKEVNTDGGKTISLLIEKDFACLDGTEEDNAGSYPNPLINCQPKEGAER
jgi:hypothetical protein